MSATGTDAAAPPHRDDTPLRRAIGGKVGGALWLPFVIGFVVAILTAASYVELVGKYPKAAGAALYTQKAFQVPFLTFIVAFMVMCSACPRQARRPAPSAATTSPNSGRVGVREDQRGPHRGRTDRPAHHPRHRRLGGPVR